VVDLSQCEYGRLAGFTARLNQRQSLLRRVRGIPHIRGDLFAGVTHGFDSIAYLGYLGGLLLGIGGDGMCHLADPVSRLVGLVCRSMDSVQDGFEAGDEMVDRAGQVAYLVVVMCRQPSAQIAIVQMADLADDTFQALAQGLAEQRLRDRGHNTQR